MEHDSEDSVKSDGNIVISDLEPSESTESITHVFQSVIDEQEDDTSFADAISDSQSISLLSFQISGENNVNINYKESSPKDASSNSKHPQDEYDGTHTRRSSVDERHIREVAEGIAKRQSIKSEKDLLPEIEDIEGQPSKRQSIRFEKDLFLESEDIEGEPMDANDKEKRLRFKEQTETTTDEFKSGNSSASTQNSLESMTMTTDDKENDTTTSGLESSNSHDDVKFTPSRTSRSSLKRRPSGTGFGAKAKSSSKLSNDIEFGDKENDTTTSGLESSKSHNDVKFTPSQTPRASIKNQTSGTGFRHKAKSASKQSNDTTSDDAGSRKSDINKNDWDDYSYTKEEGETTTSQDTPSFKTTSTSYDDITKSRSDHLTSQLCTESCRRKCKPTGQKTLRQAQRSLHQARTFREKLHKHYQKEADVKVPEIYEKNPALKKKNKPAHCAVFLEAGGCHKCQKEEPLIRGANDLRKFLDIEGSDESHDVGRYDTKLGNKLDTNQLSFTTRTSTDCNLSSDQSFKNNTILNSGKVSKWLDSGSG